jgi:hypothetical protein
LSIQAKGIIPMTEYVPTPEDHALEDTIWQLAHGAGACNDNVLSDDLYFLRLNCSMNLLSPPSPNALNCLHRYPGEKPHSFGLDRFDRRPALR